MKSHFIFVALAAFVLCACDDSGPDGKSSSGGLSEPHVATRRIGRLPECLNQATEQPRETFAAS
jgi:hypothetical protein